jgi:hypothetical protein
MTTTGAGHDSEPADRRPTREEARRAALHERQVAQVRASLLRGISYEHSRKSEPASGLD